MVFSFDLLKFYYKIALKQNCEKSSSYYIYLRPKWVHGIIIVCSIKHRYLGILYVLKTFVNIYFFVFSSYLLHTECIFGPLHQRLFKLVMGTIE